MNCKNCHQELEKNAHFCNNCGGKVIENRISFKSLLKDLFTNILGVDGLYFKTLKGMFTKPHLVLNEYTSGVRKRYVNPFGFLAVSAAISLIVFNFFADDFINFQKSFNSAQLTELKETAEMDLSALKNITDKELQKLKIQKQTANLQLEFQDKWLRFFLNYLNLFAFIFLPIYALISKFTFRKPYNFGEHIIMNAYLQGSTMFISIIFFFIAMAINPNIYGYSVLVIMLYYLYVFSKIYNLSIGKSFFKFLRFLIILIIFIILSLIIIGILSFIIGLVLAKLGILKI